MFIKFFMVPFLSKLRALYGKLRIALDTRGEKGLREYWKVKNRGRTEVEEAFRSQLALKPEKAEDLWLGQDSSPGNKLSLPHAVEITWRPTKPRPVRIF